MDHNKLNFKLGVFVFIMLIIVLILFIFSLIDKENNDSICIDGYITYYYYGYNNDNILIFEIGTSSEANNNDEKTIYVLNPGQKDHILRYNTVNSKIEYYVSKKSVYEIRRKE